MIAWNSRNLANPTTGVQRYTSEVIARLPASEIEALSPPASWSSGSKGHLWEQSVLPFRLGGRLLWSPANTGPLMVERQVLSLMDMSPIDNPERLSPQFAAWYRFLLPKLLERVRHVVTISEFSRERILARVPSIREKITVTPLAADERFRPAGPDAIAELVTRLQIPTSNYLVAVGSLEPRKNLPRLMDAWRIAQSFLPDDVTLVIAGGEGKKAVFGDYAMREPPPRTVLTGRIEDSDLPTLYSGAIASIYISLYEGFGLPPLESMACGTPVIASTAGAVLEVVGDSAVIVDPLDTEAIADGIVRLVEDSDLQHRLRTLARVRAARFSWEQTARQTWAVLKEAGER